MEITEFVDIIQKEMRQEISLTLPCLCYETHRIRLFSKRLKGNTGQAHLMIRTKIFIVWGVYYRWKSLEAVNLLPWR